jgi:predicted component of type VI protein secretion system
MRTSEAARHEPPARPGPGAVPAPIIEVRLRNDRYNRAVAGPGGHGIGRAVDNAIRLDDPTVSRHHAGLIISDDRAVAYIQDRGGANVTLLNQSKVEGFAIIKEGDTITVGNVTLTVEVKRG